MAANPPTYKRQRGDQADVDEDPTDRACDACRTRRVKCDRATPCSNCKRRRETCTTTVNTNPESKHRPSITKEYEKKFDIMADRLANIERLLLQQQSMPKTLLQDQVSEISESAKNELISASTTAALPSPESQLAATDPETCDATTETHSTVAQKVVEQAVQGSLGTYQDSELIAALGSLKDMVARMEDGSDTIERMQAPWRPLNSGSAPIEPPSASEIQRLVDESGGSIAMGFTPGLTTATLKEKSESVFGSADDTTPIRRAYVFGTLRNLCAEYGGQHEDKAFAARCKDLEAYFSVEVGHAVNDLKLITPATPEAASALTMASGAAMEICRPLVAQCLSSKAATIVLSLGYNRLSSMRHDDEHVRQVKIFTFWMAYWLDTSFSVRLGRAPIIQPDDIGVPQLPEDSIIPKGWAVAFNYSTRISGLQCKVVAQLYTPAAVRQPVEERRRRANQLLNDLQEAWEMRGPGPTSIALWKDSDAVMQHSTVCLVKHATMVSGTNESPALESARQALSLHIRAWETHKHLPDFIWSGHCHWTLLKGPITPFIVTFCHIIAHPLAANEDLRLLDDFVRTVERLRRFSDGMIKLHRLCDIFCKVATLYARSKAREVHQAPDLYYGSTSMALDLDANVECIGQPALNDIGDYLSTMGFAPPPVNDVNGEPPGLDDSAFDPSFLVDWYQGSNSLMGFLEQDTDFWGGPAYSFQS